MPRVYYCKKCGESHDTPTGKHCRRRDQTDPEPAAGGNSDLMEMLRDIKSTISDIDKRVQQNDTGLLLIQQKLSEQAPEAASNPPEAILVEQPSSQLTTDPVSEAQGAVGGQQAADTTIATPQTIRNDARIMRQAMARLARLHMEDSDDDEPATVRTSRSRGKKSGSVLTAAETVEESIDWPHLYVRRAVGGRRKPVTFGDLRVEEFVFGFLSMIDSPKCKWDYRTMTLILKNLMLDAMDFTWGSALSFYEIAGLEVEMGVTEWANAERIQQLRTAYSRVVLPAKEKEKPKETPRPAPQAAPPGTKTCDAYQRAACEHDRDHPPLTHACAYCHRTKSLLCRHAQNSCYRKANDSKNVRPGGQ